MLLDECDKKHIRVCTGWIFCIQAIRRRVHGKRARLIASSALTMERIECNIKHTCTYISLIMLFYCSTWSTALRMLNSCTVIVLWLRNVILNLTRALAPTRDVCHFVCQNQKQAISSCNSKSITCNALRCKVKFMQEYSQVSEHSIFTICTHTNECGTMMVIRGRYCTI